MKQRHIHTNIFSIVAMLDLILFEIMKYSISVCFLSLLVMTRLIFG